MNKNDIKKINKIAKNLEWSITINNDEFTFQRFSPAGQDFSIEVSANSLEELAEVLQERYDNFDCSAETYIWLDDTGHGTNGAPYDMKDLYEDMEKCEEMLRELAVEIQSIV